MPQIAFLSNREEVNSFENLIKTTSSNPPKYQYNPGYLVKRTKALSSIHTLELIEKNFPEVKNLKPATTFLERLALEASSKICQKMVDRPKEHVDLSESEKQGYIRIFPALLRLDGRLNRLAKSQSSLHIMNSKPESLFTEILYRVGIKCRVTTQIVEAQIQPSTHKHDHYKIVAVKVSDRGEDSLFEAVIPKKTDLLTIIFILVLREVSGRLYWNIKREISIKYLNHMKTYEDAVKIYKPEKSECLKSLQTDLSSSKKQDDSNNDHSATSRTREKLLEEILVDPNQMLTMTLAQLKTKIREYLTQYPKHSTLLLENLTRKSDLLFFDKEVPPLVISLSICIQRIHHNDIFILRYKAETEGFSSVVSAFGQTPKIASHPEFAGLLFQEACQILSALKLSLTIGEVLEDIENLSQHALNKSRFVEETNEEEEFLEKRDPETVQELTSTSQKALKLDQPSSSTSTFQPKKISLESSPNRDSSVQEEITVNYKKLTSMKQVAIKTCSFKQKINQMKLKKDINETVIDSTSTDPKPESFEPHPHKIQLLHEELSSKASTSNPKPASKSAAHSPNIKAANRSSEPTPDITTEEIKTVVNTETITSEDLSSNSPNRREEVSSLSVIEDEPLQPPPPKRAAAMTGNIRRTEKYFQMLDRMFQRK